MAENPYDAPFTVEVRASAAKSNRTIPRPVGVSLLAVLHCIGGVVLFGLQLILFANLDATQEALRSIGIPPALLMVAVMFLSVLTIASSVGMWLGTRWGWWLATFYYIYGVFRNTTALVTVVSLADELQGTTRGPEYYFIKHGGRIVVHFLLLLYFFKGNVLDFFGLERMNKLKAVGILTGICVALTAFGSAISWLAS